MRAGKLDRRITILRNTPQAANAFNEALPGWAEVATVWAQQRPNRGDEALAAQQDGSARPMTFHIRYRSDLSVTDRISYEGRIFEILDVRELGRRVVSEFDCIARAD